MKKLFVLMMAVLVLGLTGVLMAADDVPSASSNTVGGTVPWCAEWTMSDPDQTSAMDAVQVAQYTANHIDITDVQVCTAFSSNDTCYVKAKIGTWNLPDGYKATGANKNTVDATSDFKILVNNMSGDLIHEGSFNSYQLLTSTDQPILKSDLTSAPYGIEAQNFDIDCEIDMDWVTDIPGDYSITFTLTLVQGLSAE